MLVFERLKLLGMKTNFPQKCLAFLNVYYQKTHLIKALNFLDSSRANVRLSQNPETGGFRELFLPENDFKTCSPRFSGLSYLTML